MRAEYYTRLVVNPGVKIFGQILQNDFDDEIFTDNETVPMSLFYYNNSNLEVIKDELYTKYFRE